MKKPSMMMLVTNAKVREAVAKVTKAVKEAGVDGEALKVCRLPCWSERDNSRRGRRRQWR